MINQDLLDSFFPEGIEPTEQLLNNTHCLRLPIAWALSGWQAQDAAQWLVDVCAYQEIPRGEEIAALCTGYCQLMQAGMASPDLATAQAQEQLRQMLSSLQKLQLASLETDAASFPPLAALPVLRDTAAELVFGEGCNETRLFFKALLQLVLPTGWLEAMAGAQRQMYASMRDEDAEAVARLWQQLMDALLPTSLQTAAFVENCLYYTEVSLTAAWPEEMGTWSAVTESFYRSMDIEKEATACN